MINFVNACEKAQEVFIKRKYKKGITEICDLGDRWLFVGTIFGNGSVEYGNVPITISKETGKSEDFPLNLLENLKTYYSSEDIMIPKKFQIT